MAAELFYYIIGSICLYLGFGLARGQCDQECNISGVTEHLSAKFGIDLLYQVFSFNAGWFSLGTVGHLALILKSLLPQLNCVNIYFFF